MQNIQRLLRSYRWETWRQRRVELPGGHDPRTDQLQITSEKRREKGQSSSVRKILTIAKEVNSLILNIYILNFC